jgi:hypothetical protein
MRDLEAQLRSYGAVLDRTEAATADLVDALPHRARRARVVAIAAAVVVAMAVSAVAIVATRSNDARRPAVVTPTSTTVATTAGALDVVSVIAKSTLPQQPLAVADGDVWIATESLTSAPFVHLEGRDPSTAKVARTIDVPQEAVFAIAADGDTLWVAGGGDGGVPETTVSKVDLKSDSVVFTKTLTGTPCSCPIVAGNAGVWLVGNSSDYALHLSSTDGHVIANVALTSRSFSSAAMEARSRLLVGLEDGSVAVVDPSIDRIERSIPRPVIGDAPVEAVVGMSPVAVPAVGSDPPIDGLILRANGTVDALFATGWEVNEILGSDFSPSTAVGIKSLMWMLGGDRLQVASTHAVVSSEFAYDSARHRFRRVSTSTAAPSSQGFRNAVAAGDRLWVVYDSGPGDAETPSIVVLRVPPGLP